MTTISPDSGRSHRVLIFCCSFFCISSFSIFVHSQGSPKDNRNDLHQLVLPKSSLEQPIHKKQVSVPDVLQSDLKITLLPFSLLVVLGTMAALRYKTKSIRTKEKMEPISESKSFVVRSGGKDILIESPEVLFVRSLGNYIEIHTSSGKTVIRERLYNFMSYVPDKSAYMRVHRSVIVRIDKITGKSACSVVVGSEELKIGNTFAPCLSQLEERFSQSFSSQLK